MDAKKRQFGQFFTTNVDFILKHLHKYVADKDITDPFAGAGDLLNWAQKHHCRSVCGYDIDQNYVQSKVALKDSIKEPANYKFVLTNPPYLHKNKAEADLKYRYQSEYEQFEDLYQISLNSLLEADEGIVIVPLNFLSADNAKKIRTKFLSRFKIVELNLFTKQVFQDTTYNVIAFYFKRSPVSASQQIKVNFVFEKKSINLQLRQQDNWEIGGEFLQLIRQTKNELGITRLTTENKNQCDINSNHLILTAIDKRKEKLNIKSKRELGIPFYVGKPTSRNQAHLIFTRSLNEKQQLQLKQDFNDFINSRRQLYNDLFLTNFRDNNRKRISFHFAYKLLNYLYYRSQAPVHAERQLNLL